LEAANKQRLIKIVKIVSAVFTIIFGVYNSETVVVICSYIV
jgi:hypothetical protein